MSGNIANSNAAEGSEFNTAGNKKGGMENDIMFTLDRDGPNYTNDIDESDKDIGCEYVLPEILWPYMQKRFSRRAPNEDEIKKLMPTDDDRKLFSQGGWKKITGTATFNPKIFCDKMTEGAKDLEDMEVYKGEYFFQAIGGGRELRIGVEKNTPNPQVYCSIDYQVVKNTTK